MSMNKTPEQVWDEFLQHWPLESLPDLTLPQYSTAGDSDTLTYWLEVVTEELGSIWGGSAFKFGIYSRKDKTDKKNGGGSSYTNDYAWYSKYGDSPEAAFENVKSIVLNVANAARQGNLAAIESVDLGTVTKWKVAFLYQDRSAPCIVPLYLEDSLRQVSGMAKPASLREIHSALMAKRNNIPLLEYGRQLWTQAEKLKLAWSTERMKVLLDGIDDIEPVKAATKKKAGYQLPDGRQLAVNQESKTPSLFLEPGAWQQVAEQLVGKLEFYPPERSRHSGLEANAPRLHTGNPAVLVTVPSENAFRALLDAYLDPDNAVVVQVVAAFTKKYQAMTNPLNQIFYGPPGTGKTYETIYAALQILNPAAAAAYKQVEDDDDATPDKRLAARTELKARFDELSAEQRVRFVTFHQSFSYEDFVEGLRADNDEAGQLQYVVQNGVFKQIVRDAQHVEVSGQSTIQVADDAKIWKVSIGGTGSSSLKDYCLKHGQARIGWSELGDMRQLDEDGKQYLASLGSNDRNTVLAFAQEIAVGDVIVSIDGQDQIGAVGVVTRDYFFEELPAIADNHYPHAVGVDWLYKNLSLSPRALNDGKPFTQKTVYHLWRFKWPVLLDAILKSDARAEETARVSSTAAKLPHVLIIDEINRGNISRIFGELITLIEPSKRAGADEALSVTLPYSKERFSVPDNVYLIGTMNTADRSLAGLDLALRRRFTFTEMPPRPELLEGISLEDVEALDFAEMLTKMNQRITVLLDRDHTIGHAYFMPLQTEPTLARLAAIFRQAVLPLLQEYFFEDWERIRWVLNDQNKPQDSAFIVEDKSLDLSGLFNGVQDRLRQLPQWVLNNKAFANPEAYLGIAANLGQAAQGQSGSDEAVA